MRQKRKRGCGYFFGLFVVGVFCVLVFFVGIVLLGLPETLIDVGPASESLEPVEKVTLVTYLLLHLQDLNSPSGDPSKVIELEVFQGDSAAVVVSRLEASGLLGDGTLLRNYLHYRGLDTSIEAGLYNMNGGMSVRQIAMALQRAQVQERVLTVVEGWRREQIAEALEEMNVGIPANDFLQASTMLPTAYSSLTDIPQSGTLEGFLFPDTYSLDIDMSSEELVQTMLENFDRRVTEEIRAGFQSQGLSMYQATTLASIVEREAVVSDERELIASVFLNRLALESKLEADPTVQYALGLQPDGGWWKAPLSFDDLKIDSPYNTYLYPGLPVGPISNPGLESLKAVAYPAITPYLYFRAMCDGSGRHSFAETFAEHQNNACE